MALLYKSGFGSSAFKHHPAGPKPCTLEPGTLAFCVGLLHYWEDSDIGSLGQMVNLVEI